MSINKRYYWYKMKEDFFNNDAVIELLDEDNGYVALVIYEMLCLKSLKTDGQVYKEINGEISAHSSKSLSRLFGVNEEKLKESTELLLKYNFIHIDEDGIITITNFDDLVGSETKDAKRKRDVRLMGGQCPPEIEIDIDKEIKRIRDKEEEEKIKINNPFSIYSSSSIN